MNLPGPTPAQRTPQTNTHAVNTWKHAKGFILTRLPMTLTGEYSTKSQPVLIQWHLCSIRFKNNSFMNWGEPSQCGLVVECQPMNHEVMVQFQVRAYARFVASVPCMGHAEGIQSMILFRL